MRARHLSAFHLFVSTMKKTGQQVHINFRLSFCINFTFETRKEVDNRSGIIQGLSIKMQGVHGKRVLRPRLYGENLSQERRSPFQPCIVNFQKAFIIFMIKKLTHCQDQQHSCMFRLSCPDEVDLAVYMEKSWPSQEGDPIITKNPTSWVTPLAEPTFCSPIFKEIYEKLALPGQVGQSTDLSTQDNLLPE